MKTQMKFQRIMCLLMVIAGALSAVYSLIYCTGALANFGATVTKADNEVGYNTNPLCPKMGELYVEVQPFNNAMLIISIVMIVCAVLLYFCGTNKSRNYYVVHYVSIGLVTVVDVVASLYIMIVNGIFLGKFNTVVAAESAGFEQLAELDAAVTYNVSGWVFALGFVIYILILAACVGLVLNLLWKIKLMKGEKQLLANSPVAVAEEAQVEVAQ